MKFEDIKIGMMVETLFGKGTVCAKSALDNICVQERNGAYWFSSHELRALPSLFEPGSIRGDTQAKDSEAKDALTSEGRSIVVTSDEWSENFIIVTPDQRKMHLADECGRLRDENRDLKIENCELRRKLERFEKKK